MMRVHKMVLGQNSPVGFGRLTGSVPDVLRRDRIMWERYVMWVWRGQRPIMPEKDLS